MSRAKKASKSDGRHSKRSVRTIEIAGNMPCDLDKAGIALEQARGIIDLLIVACDDLEVPGGLPNTLSLSLFAALEQVTRADEALFGKGAA